MTIDMKAWDAVNAENKPTASKDTRKAAKLMQLAGSGRYFPLVAITTTAAEIAKGIGLSSTGSNSKTVLNSLERLSKTKMTRTVCNPTDPSTNGIGLTTVICMVAQANRKIAIALNAELSARCTNHKGVVWINMEEQRALESKPAKRLHAWLSAWACQYNKKAIGMDMLPRHIYGPLKVPPVQSIPVWTPHVPPCVKLRRCPAGISASTSSPTSSKSENPCSSERRQMPLLRQWNPLSRRKIRYDGFCRKPQTQCWCGFPRGGGGCSRT
jgi:hypothetical protein